MTPNQIKLFKPLIFALILTVGFQLAAEAQTDANKQSHKHTLTGVWDISIESDRGDRAGTLVFKNSGSQYTGKYVGTESGNERELTNITIKGDTVAFGFEVEREGQTIEFEFDARLSGQQLINDLRSVLANNIDQGGHAIHVQYHASTERSRI